MMETSGNEEKHNPTTEQPSHKHASDDSSANNDYVHNSKEFIDIHRDQHKQRACSPDKKGENILEPVVVASTVKTDLNIPVTKTDSEIVDSIPGLPVQNFKVPMEVSGESERKRDADTKLKSNDDSSEDEYQSADEGDENNVSEEDNSGDEFIPVGDEEEYTDDGRTFCKNDNASMSDENESDDKQSEQQENESNIIDDMEVRKNLEANLTEEEKQERKEKSQKLKDDGNAEFRIDHYDEAITAYSEALEMCPLNFHKERSIMFANRAACKMKKGLNEAAIQDSSCALDLHPHYLKALLRRAELYERTEKLDEALKDYQKVVELDPSQGMARAACVKLAEQIKDRNEKMKDEMIGKLKDLGNLVLRPFGLSVNNFNLQKDPTSGSYSVQFQQNPPSNGS